MSYLEQSSEFDESRLHETSNYDLYVKYSGFSDDFGSKLDAYAETADPTGFDQESHCYTIDPNMNYEPNSLDYQNLLNITRQANTWTEDPILYQLSTNRISASSQIFTSHYDDFTECEKMCIDEENEVNGQNVALSYMMNIEDQSELKEDVIISSAWTNNEQLDNISKSREISEEIARLEAIVIGCNLLSPSLSNIQEVEEQIKIKLPKNTQSRKTKRNESSTPQDKAEKTWVQNKKKNIPGLIVNRVIKSIEWAARLDEDDHLNKYYYIKVILGHYHLTPSQVTSFVQYLKEFDNQMRTWKKIQNEIDKNLSKSVNCCYERILLECVDAFLSARGQKDFDDWITDPKTRLRDSKSVLIEAKEQFRDNFSKKIKFSN